MCKIRVMNPCDWGSRRNFCTLALLARTAACIPVVWLLAGCRGPKPFSTVRPVRSIADLQAAAGRFHSYLCEPRFETSAAEVEQTTTKAIIRFNRALDAIAGQKPEEVTFTNTLQALDKARWDLAAVRHRLVLLNDVGTNEAVRAAAARAQQQLSKVVVDAAYRPEIYRAVKMLTNLEGSLKGEDLRLLQTYLEDGKRNGLELVPEEQQRLKENWKVLLKAELEFLNNVSAPPPRLRFTRAELKGASGSFLRRRCTKLGANEYLVPANIPLDDLRIEATRKRLWLAYNSAVAEQNRPLLQHIAELGQAIATQLGYASWADYMLKDSVVGTPATARAFCESLSDSVKTNFEAQVAEMTKLKASESGNAKARIELWDVSYYGAERIKHQRGASQRRLAQYFPAGRVLDGFFDLCERIMGLRIEPVRPGEAWASPVWLFAVSDARSGEPLGLIYFDPYFRPGKNVDNDFCATIIPGRQSEDGTRQCPVAAVELRATQYTRFSLYPEGVETLCHEFGHALHEVLSRSKYYEFEGNNVSRDFVEVPSEFLQMWARERETLDVLTGRNPRYLRKMLPKHFARLKAQKADHAVVYYRGNAASALADLELNTNFKPGMDAVALADEILAERYLPIPPGAAPSTRMRSLVEYSAAVYSHAWCEAIAADLLTEFQKAQGGLLDPEVGTRLRREIFETGDSRPPRVSIEKFLGRPYSTDAFFKQNGIPTSAEGQSRNGVGP